MSEDYHVARGIYYSFFSKVKNISTSLPKIYKTYVETDASGASSIFRMSPHFKTLHSVQLNNSLKKTLENDYSGEKISWYTNSGSSLSALSNICSNVVDPVFFYMNYNNYNKDADCLIVDYISKIVSTCKEKNIICIDSFGLIDGCLTTSDSDNSALKEKIVKRCGSRLSDNYIVGSTSSGRYRLLLHLNTIMEN